jgi:hypothetical protein
MQSPPPSISTIIELSNFNDTAAPKNALKAGAPQHGTRRELAQITIYAHRYSNGSMLMSQLVILWQPAAVARHCRHVGVVGCGPDNRRANKKNDHNTRVIIIDYSV